MSERKIEVIARPEAVVPRDWATEARTDQLRGDDTENVIEMAGRVCYDSFGKGRSSMNFHDHLLESGHVNPTYHAVYVFRVQGYSRSMTKELFRHHVGCSPSERSGRYVDESMTPWTTHPLLETYLQEARSEDPIGLGDDFLEQDIAKLIADASVLYGKVFRRLENWLIEKDVDPSTARKQARAAARQYLGNGLETEFVWSANIEAMRNVIRQRGGLGADAEIRDFAVRLAQTMEKECPTYFSDCKYENHGVLGTTVALKGGE